jgi:hypothetical protein
MTKKCVGDVDMMCGELDGKMSKLGNQKEIRGAVHVGVLKMMRAMHS